MKKIKYYYNTNTLRYEKLETPLRVKLLRIFGFLAAALVTAGLISYVAFQFIGSPKEKILQQQNENLKDNYKDLKDRLQSIQQQMQELEKRDNDVYRAIFEATPIPDSARAKELENKLEIATVEKLKDNQLASSILTTLNNLSSRIAVQQKSYDEVDELVKNKEQLLSHTPAIQPVSNKDLNRIASGFGPQCCRSVNRGNSVDRPQAGTGRCHPVDHSRWRDDAGSECNLRCRPVDRSQEHRRHPAWRPPDDERNSAHWCRRLHRL